MTVSDLKLKIFRQIDSLEKNRLEELYGVLSNFINDQNRGTVYEELIMAITKTHVQLLMLSATLDNPTEFANWIAKNRQAVASLRP